MQFEANTYDRTAEALRPFFIVNEKSTTPALRFRGLPNEKQQRADFTFALATVLNDIFADEGGAESLDWVQIGGAPSGGTWMFEEDDTAAVGSRSRQLHFP